MIGYKKKYNAIKDENAMLYCKLESLNEKFKRSNKFYEEQIEILQQKYRHIVAKSGGLKKENNRLSRYKIEFKTLEKESNAVIIDFKNQLNTLEKESNAVIIDFKNQLNTLVKDNEKLKSENYKICTENKKLLAIVDNLNKLISKKMKKTPSVEEIVNYDRKQPSH